MKNSDKVLLGLIMLLIVFSAKGQETFKYDITGITPKYIVIKFDSMTADLIYSRALTWIKKTYKNPDAVIKASIQNEMIRFEGFTNNLFSYKSLGVEFNVESTYTIEIEFKNGKMKFAPIELKQKLNPKGCYQPGDFFLLV